MSNVIKPYVDAIAQGITWGSPNSKTPGTVFYDDQSKTLKVIDANGAVSTVGFDQESGVDTATRERNIVLFKRLPHHIREEIVQFIVAVLPILLEMKGTDYNFQYVHTEKANALYWFLLSKGLRNEDMISAHAEASISEMIDEGDNSGR